MFGLRDSVLLFFLGSVEATGDDFVIHFQDLYWSGNFTGREVKDEEAQRWIYSMKSPAISYKGEDKGKLEACLRQSRHIFPAIEDSTHWACTAFFLLDTNYDGSRGEGNADVKCITASGPEVEGAKLRIGVHKASELRKFNFNVKHTEEQEKKLEDLIKEYGYKFPPESELLPLGVFGVIQSNHRRYATTHEPDPSLNLCNKPQGFKLFFWSHLPVAELGDERLTVRTTSPTAFRPGQLTAEGVSEGTIITAPTSKGGRVVGAATLENVAKAVLGAEYEPDKIRLQTAVFKWEFNNELEPSPNIFQEPKSRHLVTEESHETSDDGLNQHGVTKKIQHYENIDENDDLEEHEEGEDYNKYNRKTHQGYQTHQTNQPPGYYHSVPRHAPPSYSHY